MGYVGGYCIHPRQVRVLNEGFSPTDEQVEWARRVVEAFSLSIADGRSSTSIEGKMIDAPVADRARSILERKSAVEAIEDRKPSGGSRG
jgi:citrate lyase subunit beta/citryl-CoA lyase